MHKQKIKAFTLVELIVVITILAILWTIAFISLSWYSSDARDSIRISDMWSMRSSLELYQLDSGKYPFPTNWVSITYSGSIVWKQWTFWETVYANLSKLDKIPKDPLTDKEYTYSVINKQNEYELAWLMEGDTISLNPSQPSLKFGKEQNKANAWTVEAIAYTTWNYNGTMAKSLSWAICDVLSIPSIIANDVETSTDLVDIVTNKWLVYNWYKNLPSSTKWSKFKNDWWFDFTPNKLVAYTDTWSCEALTSTTSYTARVELIDWLQKSYSGSLVQNEWEINNIVNLVINVSSPSTEVLTYAWNFVNNTLGWNIIAWWSSSSSSSTTSSTGWPVARFVSSGDLTTVTDNNTWLIWQSHRDWSGDLPSLDLHDWVCTDTDSLTYCSTVSLNWLTTWWRLPTQTELVWIRNWDGTMDTAYFSYKLGQRYTYVWIDFNNLEWEVFSYNKYNFSDMFFPQAEAACYMVFIRCVHD